MWPLHFQSSQSLTLAYAKPRRLPRSILHLWYLNACAACWPVLGLKTFQILKFFVPLATNSLIPSHPTGKAVLHSALWVGPTTWRGLTKVAVWSKVEVCEVFCGPVGRGRVGGRTLFAPTLLTASLLFLLWLISSLNRG